MTEIIKKTNLNVIENKNKDTTVRVQGFISNIRKSSKVMFIVLREGYETIQCCFFGEKFKKYEEFSKLPLESYVEIQGVLQSAKVLQTSIKTREIAVERIEVLGASSNLPFTLKAASDSINEESNVKVSYHKCLDTRVLDLRTNHSRSIFKIVSVLMNSFRTYLIDKDFMEIKTSKLLESGSEGGANLFQVEYFKRKAYLAQSPQLYKQMAIIGGLQRVFEIGHVYRQEESNINRYLSEFVGLDLEMEIESYEEVIDFIYRLLVHCFDKINENKKEIEYIREYKNFEDLKYSKEPIIYTFEECEKLLEENGYKLKEKDFNREAEKKLGEIIKQKRGVDFFVVKDYPSEARPFYTKKHKDSENTRSYDFILRGEEILSGAQRISDYEELKKSAIDKGLDPEKLSSYLDSFKYGAPPHGGCGIGLERLLKSFFGFHDIRYFNIFPRDPERLNP
ncbi:aspartyl-tRNA synthetase [Spraguea lophii 42_110]|uniref:Probable aspartate--tRNA ligase, cytoplasmic n=1 Tax=Spraguea lophii (strain 42_110) TaxID=1358809 RepID=S7W7Y8_SPRLO|nr:aspartyl-tRNA synthetase [Spraguea lophii 42_110]